MITSWLSSEGDYDVSSCNVTSSDSEMTQGSPTWTLAISDGNVEALPCNFSSPGREVTETVSWSLHG